MFWNYSLEMIKLLFCDSSVTLIIVAEKLAFSYLIILSVRWNEKILLKEVYVWHQGQISGKTSTSQFHLSYFHSIKCPKWPSSGMKAFINCGMLPPQTAWTVAV